MSFALDAAYNIIPDTASFGGTIRASTHESMEVRHPAVAGDWQGIPLRRPPSC